MNDEPLADRLTAKHVRLRTMNGSGEWIDTRWCAGCGGQTEWPCDPYRAANRIAELEARSTDAVRAVRRQRQAGHEVSPHVALAVGTLADVLNIDGGTDE